MSVPPGGRLPLVALAVARQRIYPVLLGLTLASMEWELDAVKLLNSESPTPLRGVWPGPYPRADQKRKWCLWGSLDRCVIARELTPARQLLA